MNKEAISHGLILAFIFLFIPLFSVFGWPVIEYYSNLYQAGVWP